MMEKKIKILLLIGGESEEREISIMSGKAVLKNLRREFYEPFMALILKDGRWSFPDGEIKESPPYLSIGDAIKKIENFKPDCAFIAMHGPYGEDGKMQALMELMHIPYVASDVYGSSCAMDKRIAKKLYIQTNIPTPKFIEINLKDVKKKGIKLDALVGETLGFPCVLKTPRLGSSVGVYICKDEESLSKNINNVTKFADDFLLEEFIKGREITSPVLEDPHSGKVFPLPLIEIVPKKHEFFSYEAKYDPMVTDEICPAPIDEELTEKIKELGVKAHKTLMLKGFSRTDFIVSEDRKIYALETNTIPGLTEVSLFPKSAKEAGISYSKLLDILIKSAMKKKE